MITFWHNRHLLAIIGIQCFIEICCANVIVDKTTIVKHRICEDKNFVSLTTLYRGTEPENIKWYKGDEFIGSGKTISVPVEDSSEYYIICQTKYQKENLLRNGGFEKEYTAFTSEALTSSPPIPNPRNFRNNYANGDYGKHYAISTNASIYDKSFYSTRAYEGLFFGLFDVINDRFAYIVSTTDNPNLYIIKDSIYTFSFRFANPNYEKDTTNLARLYVELVDSTENIIARLTPENGVQVNVNNHQWQYYSIDWKATLSLNNISLRLKNLSPDRDGGDFCIDDIVFSTMVKHSAYKEIHTLTTKQCDKEEEQEETIYETEEKGCVEGIVYSKWNNMLFVDNGIKGLTIMEDEPIAYQWFKNDIALEGENGQIYYNPQGMDGELYVRITLKNGTIINSCPQLFEQIEKSADRTLSKLPDVGKKNKRSYSILFGNLHFEIYLEKNEQPLIIKKIIVD